jgi:tuftelin-interacting protein 11
MNRKRGYADEDEESVSSGAEYLSSNSEGDHPSSGAKKISNNNKRGKRKTDRESAVSFVSSSAASASCADHASTASGTATTEAPNKRKSTQGGDDADIGSWQKHTKGIGLKYLQKFGFKGRLGKEEDGISAPIEAVIHGGNAGLGFGKKVAPKPKESVSKSPSSSSSNNETEAWAKYSGIGEEDTTEFNSRAPASAPSSSSSSSSTHGWKKKLSRKTGAEETLTPIIDMRGGENDNSRYAQQQQKGKILGEELLHNLDLAHDIAKSDEVMLERRIGQNKNKLTSLELRISAIETHKSSDEGKRSRLESILDVLRQLEERQDQVTIISLDATLRTLYAEFEQEFKVFGLVSLIRLADPIMRSVASAWDPSNDQASLMYIFKEWMELGKFFEGKQELSIARQVQDIVHEQSKLYFLGHIRSYLTNSMDILNPGIGVQLLNELFMLAGDDEDEDVMAIFDVFVAPRLHAAINTWNFHNVGHEVEPISSWVLAWKPLLGTKKITTTFFSDIRQRLMKAIDHWDTDLVTIRKHLEPWSRVIEEETLHSFVLRNVMPKLIHFVRDGLTMPSTSSSSLTEALECLFTMRGFMPHKHFHALIDGEFFPALVDVLLREVKSERSHREVMTWLAMCRQSVGEKILKDSQKWRYAFAVAIKMVERACDGDDNNDLMRVSNVIKGPNYFALIESSDLRAKIGQI